LIKGKEYPTLASQVTDPSILFVKGGEVVGWDEGGEIPDAFTHRDIIPPKPNISRSTPWKSQWLAKRQALPSGEKDPLRCKNSLKLDF
jgi:hypothetical protein